MRITAIIIAILYSMNVMAQEKFDAKFGYEMVLNFGTPNAFQCNLYFGKNHSYFEYQEKSSKRTGEEQTEVSEVSDDYISLEVNVADNTTYFVNTDEKIKSLLKGLGKNSPFYIVEEECPQIDWTITNETKTIGKYDCIKATADFRGRSYTAWFAPEIPVQTGPYKFHGLNGLIFEIYDKTHEVSLRLTDMSFREYTLPTPDYSKYKTISRQEYRQILSSFFDNIANKLSGRVDRNFRIEVSSSNFKTIEME
ncbi:GLPGLI family protein [Porphyromonas macacae]|uniref:GLPGLI family protein n=1 Tax=Porphyromonas macacae TaxID=28115 RepID=UPI0024AD3812|nr:GLPGLI family protein [Porphyromonas macacae]